MQNYIITIKNKLNFFVLFLLLASCFLLLVPPKAGAEELAISVSPTVTPTPAPVAYTLPYPGILPGHFLYPLKELRDTVMGALVSNPLKKAELYLLQADKKVETSRILFNQRRFDDGYVAMERALLHFEQAIQKREEAKKQGMDTADIVKRLGSANKKHLEVTKEMQKNKGQKDEKFQKGIEKLEQFGEKVNQIKP